MPALRLAVASTTSSVRCAPCRSRVLLRCSRLSHAGQSRFELGQAAPLDTPGLLGFAEQAPLPMFEPLLLGRHRSSGDDVLLAGFDDPLAEEVDDIQGIGYVEAYPIHPRLRQFTSVPYGLEGLVRVVDLQARRHRYGIGDIPHGMLAGELGALLSGPAGDCVPLFIDDDGRISTSESLSGSSRPVAERSARTPPQRRPMDRRSVDVARLQSARAQDFARR